MNEHVDVRSINQSIKFSILDTDFNHDNVIYVRKACDSCDLDIYTLVTLDIERVTRIDSTAVGFIYELNNKITNSNKDIKLIVHVGKNHDLKELLKKFQVDKLATFT